MARWRAITLILFIFAVVLWAAVFSLGLRPELGREVHLALPGPSNGVRLEQPFSRLPPWVASAELFVTLFLAGLSSLLVFPARIQNMLGTLAMGWRHVLSVTLLGIGFALLLVVFGIGAALARITFPFTILAGFLLVFLSIWGFLAGAYALGRFLLVRAGWGHWSSAAALALGLLLLLPLARIPYAGGIFVVIYVGLGLGLVISTRFGSNERWSLMPLLEEDRK